MMNEKIRQLMVNAIAATFDDECDNPELEKELKKMYIPNAFSEHFANLIIRECISVCENSWAGEFTICGIKQCVDDLKKHFNVSDDENQI